MRVNAETLYAVYETTERNHDPDLVFGLAKLRVTRPDITQEQDRAMREFIGWHTQELAKAYKEGKAAFLAAVEVCTALDEERARQAAEAAR